MVLPADRSADSSEQALAEWAVPDWRSATTFRAKVFAHRLRRRLADLVSSPRRWDKAEHLANATILGECRSALWSDERPEERAFQLGKVQNLRRATAALDGVLVPAGAILSFWRQIGRASRWRGYVAGRMLKQGCLVPATGGGLCQLSNAIYEAALQAGCEIVERHAHSRIVPGSAAATGRDATVAWNYVDLRFRPQATMQIEARLSRDELIIRFVGQRGTASPVSGPENQPRPSANARTCGTCGEVSCFRHERHPAPAVLGRTAYLVDDNWPELQDYIAREHQPEDILGLPIDGKRWRLPRYDWRVGTFARTASASVQTLRRMIAIRRAPAQGAARRGAELRGAERIAGRLARLLTPDVMKLCVAQSLLPYLWRDGHLGGREVEVLMTRLPLAELHARLDRAVAAHPERATLGDFRAPLALVAAEAEALAYASRIVTPHRDVARLFRKTARILDWKVPSIPRVEPGKARRIAFPGPTVARKGAHAVRDAAKTLGLEVIALGSELEGPGFWNGIAMHKPAPDANWLAGVAAVVQPAIVEERPRHLLMAIAAGVPVIATAACGLAAENGVTIVPADDAEALVAALRTVLG
jgi:hypothetical protein